MIFRAGTKPLRTAPEQEEKQDYRSWDKSPSSTGDEEEGKRERKTRDEAGSTLPSTSRASGGKDKVKEESRDNWVNNDEEEMQYFREDFVMMDDIKEEEIDCLDGGSVGVDGERLAGVAHYPQADMFFVPDEGRRYDTERPGLDAEFMPNGVDEERTDESTFIEPSYPGRMRLRSSRSFGRESLPSLRMMKPVVAETTKQVDTSKGEREKRKGRSYPWKEEKKELVVVAKRKTIDSNEAGMEEEGERDEKSDDIRVTNRGRRPSMASTSTEMQGTDGREREDDVYSMDVKESSIGNESILSRRSIRIREQKTKADCPAPSENGVRRKSGKEATDATIQSPLRYSVDNARTYNYWFSNHPVYKRLRQAVMKHANMKYKKRRFDDPDLSIADPRIYEEVELRSHEGPKTWDQQYKKAGYNADFVVDHIITTTPREVEGDMPEEFLAKFTEYPVPNWSTMRHLKTTYAMIEFTERTTFLDTIEFRIRAEQGDDFFERHFPNRYLKWEAGEGNGGYVKNKLALAKNRLRSIESRWNWKNRQAGLPEIFIEDWTPEGADDAAFASLASLDFLNYLVPSEDVERLITGHKQLKDVICTKECRTCKVKVKKGGTDITKCCASNGLIVDTVECDDRCACDEKKCGNRTVQNGRQLVLCVFREPVKGWGVRTMTEIDNVSFISEYCGEVRKTGLTGNNSVYDFDMTHAMPSENGKTSPESFVICGGERSNEARFLNHCCVPNLRVEVTVIEKYGPFYHHLAFFSQRRIMAGEELHFNYFEGVKGSVVDYSTMLGAGCTCGSKRCLFPLIVKKIESARKERKESKRRREETTDDEEMGDVEASMSSRHTAQTARGRGRPKTSSRYSQPPGNRGRVDDDDVIFSPSLSVDEEEENISINGKSDKSTSRGSKRMRRDEDGEGEGQ